MKDDSKKVKRGILSDGKYYLIFLLMTIIGWGLVFAFPGSFVIGAVGVAIGLVGFYSLLSVPMAKYTYSETKIVRLDSGEEVKCLLIKKQYQFISLFAMAFRFLKFLSPFYFIPTGTQYLIVSNVDRSDNSPGKFTEGQFEKLYEYLNCEPITRKRYKELMSNPQLYKDELTQKLSKQREVFFKVAEKFEKNNLMEREICTEKYAIYKFSDEMLKILNNNVSPDKIGLRIKFNYTGDDEHQNGFFVYEELLKQNISYEMQNCFEDIIERTDEYPANDYVEINNKLFSTLTIRKGINENKLVDIDELEEIKETDSRTVLTKEMVCNVARHKRKGGWLALTIIGYYFAIGFVGGCLMLLFSLDILGFLGAAALTAPVIAIAEYARRKNKKIARVPSIDEIEIVKTYCSGKRIKNIDGNDVQVYVLGNGLEVAANKYKLHENATCYIVYRKPENEVKFVYSAMEVKLAPDLQVTDTINE